MHKKFYASGFIYHQSSQQILLQQNTSVSPLSPSWLLFGGSYLENEEPELLFKDVMLKLLDIKIKTVNFVYSYCNEITEDSQYIVYSKVNKLQDFSAKNGFSFAWFSFNEIIKLKITEQTKHDIVVGQRVIDAAGRKSRGEHTFQ